MFCLCCDGWARAKRSAVWPENGRRATAVVAVRSVAVGKRCYTTLEVWDCGNGFAAGLEQYPKFGAGTRATPVGGRVTSSRSPRTSQAAGDAARARSVGAWVQRVLWEPDSRGVCTSEGAPLSRLRVIATRAGYGSRPRAGLEPPVLPPVRARQSRLQVPRQEWNVCRSRCDRWLRAPALAPSQKPPPHRSTESRCCCRSRRCLPTRRWPQSTAASLARSARSLARKASSRCGAGTGPTARGSCRSTPAGSRSTT